MCRAPGPPVLFGAGRDPGAVQAAGAGGWPVNEPSLCRLAGCEVPSLTHLVLSVALVFFAVAVSML